MTSGGFDPGAGIRSANTFACQHNPLSGNDFAKVTVEDELDAALAENPGRLEQLNGPTEL